MSISALSHQIDAEYEFVGKTIFEHYTYLSDRDPASYFPSMPTGPTAQATQAFNTDYKNLTDVQAIVDQMLADNLITSSSDMDFLINYHEDMMEQVDNGSIRSFGNLWYFLHEKELSVESDPHLTDEEKELLLCLSSAVRNTLKYAYVTGQVDDRGFLDNCFFGIKVKCWLKVGVNNLLKLTAYYLLLKKAIAAAVATGGAATPLVIAYAALAQSVLIDVLLALAAFEECECGDGDPFECNPVDGIVVESITCTDVQQVRAIGYGTYTGQFQWHINLSSAEAVDFPGDPNPITDGPTLKVRQVNPSVNPTIGVRLLTCPDPDAVDDYKYTTQLNLIAASLDPGTLLVTGPAEAQTEQTEHFYLNGTAAGKPNNVFAMSVDQPGYVVTTWSPMTRLAVRWDVIPNGGLGVVRGNATACGGHTVNARRDVPVEDNL